MRFTGFSKAAATAASLVLFSGQTKAATLFYQISDVTMSGEFFAVSGGGTFDSAGHSNVSLTEIGPGFSYGYSLSGSAYGSGWQNIPSQHPPTLCITSGCDPFDGPVPGSPEPFSFHLNLGLLPATVGETITVSGGGEDDIEPYSGTAKITRLPSPAPEPTTWALLLAGFGLAGMAIRHGRRGARMSQEAV